MRFGKRITLFSISWCNEKVKIRAQPWPRVILDDYSRAVAGLFLFFEAPSAAQTALAAPGVIAKRLLLDFTLAPFRGSRLRIVSADVVIDRFA